MSYPSGIFPETRTASPRRIFCVEEFIERALAAILLIVASPTVLLSGAALFLCGATLRAQRLSCIGRGGDPIELRAVDVHFRGTGMRRIVCDIAASILRGWLAFADVAAGKLAFVGPRARCAEEPLPSACAADILAVRPGLVSLWGLRARLNICYGTEEQADLEYLSRRTLKTDLGILVRHALTSVYGAAHDSVPLVTDFFGVRHLNLAMSEVLDMLAVTLRRRQHVRIAFVNPDCVNLAERTPEYKTDLTSFDWVLTDGIGMIIAGRLLGQPVRQNVNGTDLFPRLCELLEETGHSFYLLGGGPGVAEGVVRWLRARHPGVRIAGFHHGYFGPHDAPLVISGIRRSGASVLLVGLGAPRQERWIVAHGHECGALVTIGVGGLFDYYSGRIPRAPQWLRELGCEWVYRLIQEPRRLWKRYLVGNVIFLLRVLRAYKAQRGKETHEARR